MVQKYETLNSTVDEPRNPPVGSRSAAIPHVPGLPVTALVTDQGFSVGFQCVAPDGVSDGPPLGPHSCTFAHISRPLVHQRTLPCLSICFRIFAHKGHPCATTHNTFRIIIRNAHGRTYTRARAGPPYRPISGRNELATGAERTPKQPQKHKKETIVFSGL